MLLLWVSLSSRLSTDPSGEPRAGGPIPALVIKLEQREVAGARQLSTHFDSDGCRGSVVDSARVLGCQKPRFYLSQ